MLRLGALAVTAVLSLAGTPAQAVDGPEKLTVMSNEQYEELLSGQGRPAAPQGPAPCTDTDTDTDTDSVSIAAAAPGWAAPKFNSKDRRGKVKSTRVVLWDGRQPQSSVAYDVPLIHPQGDDIPWTHLIAALRQVLVHRPVPDSTDPLGIPLADARRHILDTLGLDVSLHGKNGRVHEGNTALMAALPSLVPDELDSNRSPAQDSCAPAGVYDFTHG
ncbi:hypothetical protein ACFTWS_30675 [Streptomyces sp. NPDC057027]|uniref:hypothetical protein n=1 Tax=Streptomyces sp. NPDC057027 TaxID=3346004 RepID=UPI0036448820